ncbi:MAG: zinc carboxypeptidase [Candidatus Riflebacteria bacterium]|nr:zinc carboxypeptidase [Candidatus Riflebacteria bacterium]
MKLRGLLALAILGCTFSTMLTAAGTPPPRLVRYHFTTTAQLASLARAGADIVSTGKDWADVLVPADARPRLTAAVRSLRSRVLMEDAEAPMRRFKEVANLGVYHTLDEVKAELDATVAAHPNLAKLSEIGQSVEGRKIWAVRISSCPEDGKKPAFLFTGAHHSREWISIEVPMGLIKRLVEGYAADAGIRKLVDEREIWIVPVMNPDGVHYSQTEYKMWRKNRRKNADGSFGVDVNRNYGYKWGQEGASADPGDETFRGPAAFSEPETRAIRDLSLAKKFIAAISFHSYSELVLWPWGYTYEATPDGRVFNQVGAALGRITGYKPEQSCQLYPTSGDFDDYMYGELGTLAFTIELGKEFVPEEHQVAGIVESNDKACLWLLENAADPFPPLQHDPLASTIDRTGPYPVTARLRKASNLQPSSVELVFNRAGSQAEQRAPMTAGQDGLYSGQLPGGALGKLAYHFELAAGDRKLRVPAQGEFSFSVVDSLVLIVADDDGAYYTPHYTAALDLLGKAYAIYEMSRTSAPPSAAVLRSASAVVWFTGNASRDTLTAADQNLLKAYLADGGRLLLFGQDIGYELKNSPFYKDVLKARYVADNSQGKALVGAAGTFAAGLSCGLGGAGAEAQNFPEGIEALAGASALMRYDNGQTGAVVSESGKARLAYFGFGLEGVSPLEARQQLLGKALDWLASSARQDARRANFR